MISKSVSRKKSSRNAIRNEKKKKGKISKHAQAELKSLLER